MSEFDDLLPLPISSGCGTYDDFDMQDYAARCVAAERDRCAAFVASPAACLIALKGRTHPNDAALNAILQGLPLPPGTPKAEEPQY